jgi:cytochrome P450
LAPALTLRDALPSGAEQRTNIRRGHEREEDVTSTEQAPLPDDFDPLVSETFGSAHEEYKTLRQHCPVAHTSTWEGFWLLTRYSDVARVSCDPDTFTTTVQNVVPRVAFTGRRPPLHLDPPEHTPYRRALNPFFTQEKIRQLEPEMRQITIQLLTPLIQAGGCDFCEDFLHSLPAYIFARFFNMPDDVALRIREITKIYGLALQGASDDLVKAASRQLYEIAREMIEQRRAEPMDPRDDPASALLGATYRGATLPDDMLLGTLRQFIVVGMIAPIVFLGSCVVHLSEHPEIQDQLRADQTLIPDAVAEYLRLFTPYRGFARTPRHDVEIHGRTIGKGQPIALAYASANRDESVFPDGDRFIIGRPNIGRHLAFGAGPHRCAGAPLAVAMFRIVLEELLSRTRRIEVNGPIRMSGWPEIGTLSVPVRLDPCEPDRLASSSA